MPAFQTFLNESRINQLWDNIEWILFFVAPVVMIYVAISTLGLLIDLIKKAVQNKERYEYYEDYDDYYYRERDYD